MSFGIGAPFWGLGIGVLTSRLLQRLPSSGWPQWIGTTRL
jgi:predicted benzoate:H+ symporter BenE